MSWKQILIAIPTQALCKTIYESCIVPVTAIVARKTKEYEFNLDEACNGCIHSSKEN